MPYPHQLTDPTALEWAQHHRRAAENAAYQASADYWHASGERDQLEVEKNAWLKEKADLEEELEDLQRKVAKLKSRNKALKKKVAKLEKEKNE